MKTVYAVLILFLFSYRLQAQSFTFPTSGNVVGSPLTASDGVMLIASIRSTGCAPGGGSTFVYSTSHLSTGAIYRNTSWAAGCKNSTDLIKLDFSSVQIRPAGLTFSLFDVDNGSDSVSVQIYSAGIPVAYAYSLFSPTYVTANGSSPEFGFSGSASNNSGQNDNTGRIEISTVNPSVNIDSILIYKYNNRDIVGNPSQSFAAFNWTNTVVLPVKLVSFSAYRTVSAIQCNWRVAEETGTKEYQIEYSVNGNNYLETGTRIPAKGTGAGEAIYSCAITSLSLSNTLYVRLVSTDVDGRKYYSKAIKVGQNSLTKTEVYPGKFTNGFTVALQSEKAYTGKLKLIGTDGRTVYQQTVTIAKGHNNILVTVSPAIPAGVYTVVGECGGTLIFRHKLVKE